MRVLVLNAGSSSLKYSLIDTGGAGKRMGGAIERVTDHAEAVRQALAALPDGPVEAIGHRVVHGGERFVAPTRIDAETLDALESLSALAPLHNPPALAGIRAAQMELPGVPNVAVFDTAFHATLPPHAYHYALPHNLYAEHGIRRYGFHGTSHAYVARRAAEVLERDLNILRLITLHLGNGASACAVLHGHSVDTSMGFTPLEGLVMGTRSGDLDPAVALWLAGREGMERASAVLNKESGVLGLSGVSHDLRDLHKARQEGNKRAQLALDVMTYRVRKQVGAYAAALGGLNALVFTGGIGEHDAWVRAQVVGGLAFLGLQLDEAANAAHATRISTSTTPAALVIPTDEEGEIARQTAGVLA